MSNEDALDAFGRDQNDDDHDLLTYNESNARLREEIALLDARLNDIEDTAARPAVEARLDLMRRKLSHQERRALTDRNGAGFLSYAGPGTTQD